jgi:hypothetical protein
MPGIPLAAEGHDPLRNPVVPSLLLTLLSAAPFAAGEELTEGVERVDYRDWLDCYRLSNDRSSVIVVPVSGARLSVFSLGGDNILLEDETVDGLDIEVGVKIRGQEWVQWDGCQPDVFKEGVGHQLDQLWLSPFRLVETGPRMVSFRSPVSRKHNAQVTKTFTLDDRDPRLRFDYGLTSKEAEAKRWSCYYRMLLKMPGFVVLPLDRNSAFKGGYSLKGGNTAKQRQDIGKECLRAAGGRLVIAPHKLRAAKYGEVLSDTKAGWVAAAWKDLLLVIEFETHPERDYRDNCTVSVYWELDRASVEPRGPYDRLSYGESTSCNTVWTLGRLPEQVDEFEQIDVLFAGIERILGARDDGGKAGRGR